MKDRPTVEHLPDNDGTLDRHRQRLALAKGARPAPNVIRHTEPTALGHGASRWSPARRAPRPFETDERDPMRVPLGAVFMACRTMARRDVRGVRKEKRDEIASEAVMHLLRWSSQGAEEMNLGGEWRLPLRRDWYMRDENGARTPVLSKAATRAVRAAVRQAKDERMAGAVGDIEEPADPATLPALGAMAQAAEPDTDAYGAPPKEIVEHLVSAIGCPENAARALVMAAEEGARRASAPKEGPNRGAVAESGTDWAREFGISQASLDSNLSRAKAYWREAFPNAGDLIAAVRSALDAAAASAADHARAEAGDLAAGYGDPKAARRALLVYAETAGTIPPKRRAALVAAYRASGWRMAPKDAAAIVAGLTRLVGAEELRAGEWATVRGRGTFAAGIQSFASTGATGAAGPDGRIRTWHGGTPAGADEREREAIRERLSWREAGRRNPYLPLGSRG